MVVTATRLKSLKHFMGFFDALDIAEQQKYFNDKYILLIDVVM